MDEIGEIPQQHIDIQAARMKEYHATQGNNPDAKQGEVVPPPSHPLKSVQQESDRINDIRSELKMISGAQSAAPSEEGDTVASVVDAAIAAPFVFAASVATEAMKLSMQDSQELNQNVTVATAMQPQQEVKTAVGEPTKPVPPKQPTPIIKVEQPAAKPATPAPAAKAA